MKAKVSEPTRVQENPQINISLAENLSINLPPRGAQSPVNTAINVTK